MEPELHPDAAPLAFLLGTWRGEGKGDYPTIAKFAYGEELRFWHVGKPMLFYAQKTWSMEDQRPLHSEMGYWRPAGIGRIELVLAHPTGVVEVEEGTLDGTRAELVATGVNLTDTAKDVTEIHRTFEVEGDVLRYRLSMAAVGQPLTHHLSAELRRV